MAARLEEARRQMALWSGAMRAELSQLDRVRARVLEGDWRQADPWAALQAQVWLAQVAVQAWEVAREEVLRLAADEGRVAGARWAALEARAAAAAAAVRRARLRCEGRKSSARGAPASESAAGRQVDPATDGSGS